MAKKRLLLVYQPEETPKNRGFIQLFEQAGKEMDIDCRCCLKEDFMKQRWEGKPDLVLNRTRDGKISKLCEEWDIPAFHSAEFVETANNKYKTIQYLQEALPEKIRKRAWCPRSIFLEAWKGEDFQKYSKGQEISREECEENHSNKEEQELWNLLWQEGVIKSVSGHGGNEVFLAKEVECWKDILSGKDLLLQERIDSRGQDLRVYVLGGRIYQGILRTGRDGFRSNYSLGGRAEAYTLSPGEAGWVQAFIQALPEQWQGMYGIDFLRTRDGELVFNEIEEMVGCRMLYQCTKRDIVRDYLVWMREISIL